MVDAPCSHVGHVYRRFNPNSAHGIGDYVGRVSGAVQGGNTQLILKIGQF